VATATGGRLHGDDVELDGASFVPIVADRDGHDFVDAALAAGAGAFLTSEPDATAHAGGVAIEVADTLTALMDLARWARGRLDVPVVGVTGSVGKTSTKDLAAAALAAGARTWANARSFNNDQGLPTTILEAPDETEVMVLEMGMRGFGEIERLCRIGRPTVGVVTRVAEAHGELVGGIDGVARAKAELVEALPTGGTAVLNGDDPRVRAMATRTSAVAVTYGEGADCDVRITELVLDDLARATFVAVTPWGAHPVTLPVSGRHMAANAAAALTVAGVLGHDVGAAAAALAEARLSAMRMEVRRLPSGAVLVDDSYNANPTSMRAAIDALADLPASRRFAVLGTMAEILDPADEHRAIAAYARERGIEVVAVGTDLYGITPSADPLAALGSLAGGDAVLVKASRSAGLDRVAAALAGG
jgi:UDP-N-acetylmuramoyl-tripeptide--D-alanyl-D-alanine ligase